jgi:high-affinity Fe2+/Pb2+ permease
VSFLTSLCVLFVLTILTRFKFLDGKLVKEIIFVFNHSQFKHLIKEKSGESMENKKQLFRELDEALAKVLVTQAELYRAFENDSKKTKPVKKDGEVIDARRLFLRKRLMT